MFYCTQKNCVYYSLEMVGTDYITLLGLYYPTGAFSFTDWAAEQHFVVDKKDFPTTILFRAKQQGRLSGDSFRIVISKMKCHIHNMTSDIELYHENTPTTKLQATVLFELLQIRILK